MSQATADVRQELGEAPLRPFHWMLVILVALATLFDGYDTLIPSYVIHFVHEPWHLSSSSAGFLVSSGLIGFAVGSLVHGMVADRIGRRPTLIAGLLVAGVFSVLTGLWGTSFASFITLRALTGLGLGVLLPLGTAYINEYLPDRTRNRLAALGGGGFALGGVCASITGVNLTAGGNWQILFYLGGGAALLGVIYLFVFPESVEFLVAHDRPERATRLLGRIRPDRAAFYETARLRVSARPPAASWRLVLTPAYRTRTLALWASAFLLLFGVYGLSAWTPELMIDRGEGFATGYVFGAVLQGMSVVGALAGGFIADRYLGVRRSLMIWCTLGALSTVVVAFTNTTLTNVIGVGAAGLFIIGGQFLLNNVCAATYPVHARGTGAGYMLGFGRVGGILGPYIGGWLLDLFSGTQILFAAVALAALVAVGTTALLGNAHKALPSSPQVPDAAPVR
ncbi:MFS transporter [Streptomyces odontomachi]|uniref:MFS transporter n=1 Tax=Streptomyces odontomachi TaxID=2944940 RepID=UPI002109D6CB|nr:MFS transporter [Streptomyces sp. ODS25]